MTELEKNKIGMFLDELTELSKKYQLFIGACGCCDSPFLLNTPEQTKIVLDDLEFSQKKNKYIGDWVE
jgi:hypothetical protein